MSQDDRIKKFNEYLNTIPLEKLHAEGDKQHKKDEEDFQALSGDDIADMIEERKRTGVSMAKLVQRLKNVKVQTIISPGPGVPEIAARKRNRGKGADSNQT
ncbi:MAG: hypothetical protein ACOYMZ_03725 [Minisyncoccia bacterium]